MPLRLRYGSGDVAVAPERRYAAAVEYSVLPGAESDSDAGSDDVGLRALIEPGWATRREGRNRVVGAIRRAHVAGSADRQHPGSIAGRRYPAVLRIALQTAAVVPGSGNYGDAGANCALGGQRERIGLVRFVHGCRNREIDDANVQRFALGDRVVDRCNHVADVPAAPFVEHSQHDEVGSRRDAGSRAVRVAAVASDDASHVRTVTVLVVRRRHSVDEVDELRYALSDAVDGEVVVPARDPRIDQRDADSCPIDAEALSDRHGASRLAGTFHRADDSTIERYALDDRARRQTA